MSNLDLGRRLYDALGSGDEVALRQLLHPDFVGDVSPGLPMGFGRTYDGLDAMLGEGWGAIGEVFAMAPRLDELVEAGPYLIGRGVYTGTAIPTGSAIEARFAHFWTVREGRITSVWQVTDSAVWHAALKT